MPHSPLTPEEPPGNHAGGSSFHLAADRQGSGINGKLKRSVLEPSPASTYGGTAAGDSVPVTPQEYGSHASLFRTKLTSSIQGAHVGTGYGPRMAINVRRQSLLSSSSSPGKHSLDQGAVDSPTKRATTFVVHGKDSKADDPFVSSIDQPTTPSRQITTPSRRCADSSLSGGSKLEKTPECAEIKSEPVSPRADRNGEPLTNENAQAVLPPSACVFVANLASIRTDDQLEHSVKQIFEQYGKVYVKIRRDNRGMPYAFCQYAHDDDARRAILGGRRKLIDGRPCRTEPAKVNRSLYMSRLTGGKVTEGEARRVLQPYGPVESCWWSSKTEREMYQLPEGIWVKFAYFQDCRDAQSAFRDDSQYRLEQPPTPPEPTGRSPPRRTFQSSRPTWNNRVQARLEQGPIFETLLRQEIDRRSIFIGNLSEGTSKERVTQVFEVYGTVVHVDLVVKPSAHRHGHNTFAFVQYAGPEDATRAIAGQNQQVLDGQTIRVERKESVEQGRRGLTGAMLPTSGFSPEALEALKDQFKRASIHIEEQRQALAQFAQTTALSNVNPAIGAPQAGFLIPHPGYGNNLGQGYMGPTYGSYQAPLNLGAASNGHSFSQYATSPQHVEHEGSSGPSPSRSTFAATSYGHPGYYAQGQNPTVPYTQPSSTASNSAANLYQSYQQYQQQMYQYPPYYPVNYYQYPVHPPPVASVHPGQHLSATTAPNHDQSYQNLTNTGTATGQDNGDSTA